ncbi:MAG: class II glutamine amidotransferase [Candidatus Dormibacteraeota bacterium]|nr:class II glutamine amidotransferase [Candidatus Dormibacteraeota bacterium]
MCRLLAFSGREPLTVARALGHQDLAAFRALSRQHADGWGMAWWADLDASDDPLVERSTRCAADDPHFAEVTTTAAADSGFVHLRWATHGLPIVPANTHPFTHGPLAFAHNGAIHPEERWDEILPSGWKSQMRGTTDSERYFLAIVARLDDGEPMRDAVASVVDRIFADLQPTSLNAILLSPEALYVISAYDPTRAPTLNASSGGVSTSTEPDLAFYDLHHRIRDDSIVVASAGFPQRPEDGWVPLENMRLLRIERGTLATSVDTLELTQPTRA